jgi:putative thioredoxin
MTESAFISNVTQQDFGTAVLERSRQVPVLVDFWAAWCGPCQMLMPLLQKIVDEYAGQVYLAKVNTDEQQALANQYGVRSLPTVKIFKDGQVVDEFMGVQPEGVVREMLERHIVRESDLMRTEALERLRVGSLDEAKRLLEQASEVDPGNVKVRIDLAGLLAGEGDLEGAQGLLEALPREARDSDEVKGLLARLAFARVAQGSPADAELAARIEREPGDLEARYQLAAREIARGEFAQAMEQLLEIMRRDRGFRDDAAREGLLATFDMLGGSGDLVNRYRRQMFNLMH